MEVIIRSTADEAARLVARLIGHEIHANSHARARPRDWADDGTGLRTAGGHAPVRRPRFFVLPDVQPRRVRGPRARRPALVPALHGRALFQSREHRSAEHAPAERARRGPRCRVPGVRGAHQAGWRHRPADSGPRPLRTHRVQRAAVCAAVAHTRQGPDADDDPAERAALRRRVHGADARHHDGRRNDSGCTPRGAARDRQRTRPTSWLARSRGRSRR